MIHLFNRLLALLLACALMVGGGLVLAGVSGTLTPEMLQAAPGLRPVAESLAVLPASQVLQAALWSAGALLVGLVLFAVEARGPRRPPQVMIQRDKLGAVSVSLSGLRRLADHVIRHIAGVEGVVSEARQTRTGVAFVLRVQVAPETSMPELAEQIRADLTEAVRHHIGQPATHVEIRAEVPAPASGTSIVRSSGRRVQ